MGWLWDLFAVIGIIMTAGTVFIVGLSLWFASEWNDDDRS